MSILSIKEITHRATAGIPKIMKSTVSISIVSNVILLIKNENVTFEEHKTKYRLKISFI